jgi:hypothetical protein
VGVSRDYARHGSWLADIAITTIVREHALASRLVLNYFYSTRAARCAGTRRGQYRRTSTQSGCRALPNCEPKLRRREVNQRSKTSYSHFETRSFLAQFRIWIFFPSFPYDLNTYHTPTCYPAPSRLSQILTKPRRRSKFLPQPRSGF